MTLLGKNDGANASDGSSYLDIVAFIKSHGMNPKKDLEELWKRIVFNMAITNTDDHLRNHGFILSKSGWRLAPLYDVNPTPYGSLLSLNVNDISNEISTDLAISSAKYFDVDEIAAKKMLNDILTTVGQNWQGVASQAGIGRSGIELMRPAFKLCEKE